MIEEEEVVGIVAQLQQVRENLSNLYNGDNEHDAIVDECLELMSEWI